MASPPVVPWDLVLGTVQADAAGVLRVNVGGVLLAPLWVGAYIPTEGDSVAVIVRAGSAYVLGHVHTGARPLTGTISGSAVAGMVPVLTAAGTVQCRYVGTPPASGSLVRLDWASSTPWIWPSAASTLPDPGPGADPGGATPPAPPPPAPTTGVDEFAAVESSTWGSASGWRRYGDSVRQWRYGGEAPSTGGWFYGARPSVLAGRTITAAAIWVPARERIGSYNSGLAINLYRHTSSTRPEGNLTGAAGPHTVTLPAGWGGGWVDLPAAWGQAIVDTGGGIGCWGAPYLGVVGLSADPRSGLISLTWTT